MLKCMDSVVQKNRVSGSFINSIVLDVMYAILQVNKDKNVHVQKQPNREDSMFKQTAFKGGRTL